MKYEEREYQSQCLALMDNALASADRDLIRLPTASGKTYIFSKFIHNHRERRTLILVHRDELVSQTISKLNEFGIETLLEKADSVSNPIAAQAIIRKILGNKDYDEEEEKLKDMILSNEDRLEALTTLLDKTRIENEPKTDEYIKQLKAYNEYIAAVDKIKEANKHLQEEYEQSVKEYERQRDLYWQDAIACRKRREKMPKRNYMKKPKKPSCREELLKLEKVTKPHSEAKSINRIERQIISTKSAIKSAKFRLTILKSEEISRKGKRSLLRSVYEWLLRGDL